QMVDTYLPIIERNARQLLHMVNEVLDFRKLETGHASLHSEWVEVNSECEKIAEGFRSLAEDKDVRLMVKKGPEPVSTWLDRKKLAQILNNLLSNAWKYSDPGGEILLSIGTEAQSLKPELIHRMTLRGQPQPLSDFVEISVADEGKGISAEALKHIFESYYQAEDSQRGTGLGLLLTKELIFLHRGEILVQSAPRQGSCFSVRFPLTPVPPSHTQKTDPHAKDKARGVDLGSMPAHGLDMPSEEAGETILVIDDHLDICQLLVHQLEPDYRVFQAQDGEEGWQKIFEVAPNLIISDVMMPRLSGTELCKRIKTDIRTSHIPVILLTAKSSRENQLEGLGTGADVYLPKPFDLDLLSLQVENLLQTRRSILQRFQSGTPMNWEEVSPYHLDQQFMQRLHQAIEDHLSDSDFKVEALSQAVGMSSRNLQNKLKKLT
ncbi:MAG: hybrid sensor histidine kinase/response regulator, partial [Bacteroidota bacterium]